MLAAVKVRISVAIALFVFVGLSSLTAEAASPRLLAKGTFGPTERYTGKGTATVVQLGKSRELRLSSDFVAMNAIKLRLYLARTPSAKVRLDLGPMKARGAQRFRLPARADLKRYRYVIAWCVAANAPITQARLR